MGFSHPVANKAINGRGETEGDQKTEKPAVQPADEQFFVFQGSLYLFLKKRDHHLVA